MRELNESSGGALSKRGASMLSRLDEDHSHLFPSPSAVRMSDRTHITLDSFHIHTNHMHNIQPPEQKPTELVALCRRFSPFLGINCRKAERVKHKATNATTFFSAAIENRRGEREHVFPSVSMSLRIYDAARWSRSRRQSKHVTMQSPPQRT